MSNKKFKPNHYKPSPTKKAKNVSNKVPDFIMSWRFRDEIARSMNDFNKLIYSNTLNMEQIERARNNSHIISKLYELPLHFNRRDDQSDDEDDIYLVHKKPITIDLDSGKSVKKEESDLSDGIKEIIKKTISEELKNAKTQSSTNQQQNSENESNSTADKSSSTSFLNTQTSTESLFHSSTAQFSTNDQIINRVVILPTIEHQSLKPYEPIKDETGEFNKSRRNCVYDFNFSDVRVACTMNKSVSSPSFYCGGCEWTIQARPVLHKTTSSMKHMEFILLCNKINSKGNWTLNAYVEIRIISNIPNPIKEGSTSGKLIFNQKNRELAHIINWTKLIDPMNGFYDCDTLTIRVTIDQID